MCFKKTAYKNSNFEQQKKIFNIFFKNPPTLYYDTLKEVTPKSIFFSHRQ